MNPQDPKPGRPANRTERGPELPSASEFFKKGLFFETSLALVGLFILYLSQDGIANLYWNLESWGDPLRWIYGLGLIVLPLGFAVYATSQIGLKSSIVQEIDTNVRRVLGPILTNLNGVQIALLSLAAGVGEEMLFRGALHPFLGTAFTALIFGAVHAISWAYFIVATIMSLYLSVVYEWSHNILLPILIHFIYDWVALALYRKKLINEGRDN